MKRSVRTPKGSRTSPWSDKQLIAWWKAHISQSDIARLTGLSRQRIQQRLARHGIGGRNAVVPSLRAIYAAAGTSTSFKQVADELSISEPRLKRVLDTYGRREKVANRLARNRGWKVTATRKR